MTEINDVSDMTFCDCYDCMLGFSDILTDRLAGWPADWLIGWLAD